MQFTVLINQSRSLEWGLNAQQAMLFAFLYGCPSWATPTEWNGQIYYYVSRGKVCDEIPLLTDKPDTVYRLMRQLSELGLITLTCIDNQTHMLITEKGAYWNNSEVIGEISEGRKKIRGGSENYPRGVGKLSELGSEKNPTNQIISNHITISDNQLSEAPAPKSAKPPSFDPLTLSNFMPHDLAQSWKKWIAYRKERKLSTKESTWRAQAEKLQCWGKAGHNPCEIIENSILNGWQGLFEPKQQNTGANNYANKPKSAVERFMQEHYPRGETPQEHIRPMGGDVGDVRGVVVEVFRGDSGCYEPVGADPRGD